MIESAGVIGAGVMGKGIARHLSNAGCKVALIDSDPVHLANAEAELGDTEITLSDELQDCQSADFVIEAIIEELAIKQNLLATLSRLSEASIIASNTSSLLIRDLAINVTVPSRFLGVHYNNPADFNPIVEVIPTDYTHPEITVHIQDWYSQNGKQTVRCKDTSGFILNRQSLPYMNEAIRCLDSASQGAIDVIALSELGVGLGPFAVMNLVGLKVMAAASLNLEVLGEGYKAAQALQEEAIADNPEWEIDTNMDLSGVDVKRIKDRLLGAMIFPGKDILDQSLCSREDLHLICIEALGYKRSSPELLEQLSEDEVTRLLISYRSGGTD